MEYQCDYENDCPVKLTAEIIDRKWTTLIVRDLLPGKKRYSQLQRSLIGISPKVLAERLRFMEERALVTRRVFPTNPPTTEYELTELGRRLELVVRAMHEVGLSLKENQALAEGGMRQELYTTAGI